MRSTSKILIIICVLAFLSVGGGIVYYLQRGFAQTQTEVEVTAGDEASPSEPEEPEDEAEEGAMVLIGPTPMLDRENYYHE